MTKEARKLLKLGESDLTIADPEADVRGRTVIDSAGEEIGKVDDLLFDDVESRVQMLSVERGGFLGIGADHFLVPVDAVTGVTDDEVRIDRERSRLTDLPGYDPAVAADESRHYHDVYDWWDFPGYWDPGYAYPAFPRYPV